MKKLRSSYTIYHVYLFGSAAEHTLHEGSDIDQIIVGDLRREVESRQKIMEEDLYWLESAPPILHLNQIDSNSSATMTSENMTHDYWENSL